MDEVADEPRVVRIVLADDHRIVRGGLELVLDAEPDFEVVAQAGDIASARRCVTDQDPDVLVLDLHMPGGSALEAIPGIRSEAPQTEIVVLTMSDEPALVTQAMRTGARGYVLKEQATGDLVDAIRAVLAGRRYLSRSLADRLSADRIRRGSWD